MNVQRMLADFLSFVTPQNIHKTRMASLCASLQSLVTHGKCTVTAIGRGIQSSATEKSCIKRADRLLSNEAFQSDIPLIYAALTKALVQTKHIWTLPYLSSKPSLPAPICLLVFCSCNVQAVSFDAAGLPLRFCPDIYSGYLSC